MTMQQAVKDKQKGFTMIEMVVSLGILTILVGILSNLFGSIIDVQLSSKSTSSIDQDGRYIMAKLNYNMGNASSIIGPATPGSSASAIVKNSTDSINYTYNLNGGDLEMASSGATLKLNSADSSISDLIFTRVGIGGSSDTLQVKFTITSKTVLKGRPQIQTYQTTFGLQ